MEDFINRSYTKKELGLMYFPESMPRTAVNHLMSWIPYRRRSGYQSDYQPPCYLHPKR